MGQQRVSVNRIHIFLIARKQDQPFSVQTRRQVFTAQLDNILALALAFGRV
ncbi:hypothetical protein D3C85_1925500 [compost metagenome]